MSATLLILTLCGLTTALFAGLCLLRILDHRLETQVWDEYLTPRKSGQRIFDLAMIADLPEPARRYLEYAITQGAPLLTTAHIEMVGDFGLGNVEKPNYSKMRARQILAGTSGFVWKMSSGAISGSDGLGPDGSWTRFRIFGLLPVARTGFNADHRRSAFARAVAEAAFWAPASVLPGSGITWEKAGPDTARLTVSREGLTQSLELSLAPGGQPLSMVMPRWSNVNPNKVWQMQAFGAHFGATGEFQGYRVPIEVDAGNFFGTESWFPFFKARVSKIQYSP